MTKELKDMVKHLIRRRRWHPTPVLLPGKSMDRGAWWAADHGVAKESDTTERLHFHFSLSFTREGNGNRLQYSFMENLRDGGAWWAALSGVAQSRTWLTRLSSSSSLEETCKHLISGNRSLSNNEFLEGIRVWAELGEASPQISLNPEDLKDEIQRYDYNPSFRKTATLLWLPWDPPVEPALQMVS